MSIARNIGPEDSEAKWSHDEMELTLHGRYQGRRLLIFHSAAQENQMQGISLDVSIIFARDLILI